MNRRLTSIAANPLQGGAVTRLSKAQLPWYGLSSVVNLRPRHPGFFARPGQRKLHTTADGSNKVLSLYQFRKDRSDEKHLFAQMGDGDVLKATNDPPTVTSGVFGTEVHDGSAGQVPASWSNVGDVLIYSNGVDQHQLYGGTSSLVDKFWHHDGTATPADIPTQGKDLSDDIRGSGTATVTTLNTLAAYDCIYIKTPVRVSGFTFTLSSTNSTAATVTVAYPKSDNTWGTASGIVDGTAFGGATMAQTGTITFTAPTDIVSKFMYGAVGWWYRLTVSSQIQTITLSSVTFQGDFESLVNLWSGEDFYPAQVVVDKNERVYHWKIGPSGASYLPSPYPWTDAQRISTYGPSAIDLSGIDGGDCYIYFVCSDPIEALYWDTMGSEFSEAFVVGGAGNGGSETISDAIQYYNGSGWTSCPNIDASEVTGTDGSGNDISMAVPGWITFGRQSGAQPGRYVKSEVFGYWYRINLYRLDADGIEDDIAVSIRCRPYFDIDKFGKSMCSASWNGRAVYSFDQYSEYIYITPVGAPEVLNGRDYGIMEAGDGRSNAIVAMRPFFNELMVWQKESGSAGGCTTIFQGTSPDTYGKLVLSSRYGAMNNKAVVVVDGVKTAEGVQTLAFWVSRFGICASGGRGVWLISDDIGNYFDPQQESECIRRGYENEHWIGYDSTFHGLRVGLVTGTAATEPNTFFFYDLQDSAWMLDEIEQELSFMSEVEGCEEQPIVQIAGGVDDGTVYQCNYGQHDVDTGIDAEIAVELNSGASVVDIEELLVQAKAQSSGEFMVTVQKDSLNEFEDVFTQCANRSGAGVVRHRFSLSSCDAQNITVKIQHHGQGDQFELFALGVKSSIREKL